MPPTLGGQIDPNFFSRYSQTVQAALNSGPNVYVIVDVVSFIHLPHIIVAYPPTWSPDSTTTLAGTRAYVCHTVSLCDDVPHKALQIIGQGGPTNDQFAKLWSQIATKYASNSKIIFGV